MSEEYKFPDEKEEKIEVEVESDVEVEIVEDEKPKYPKLREDPKPLDDSEVKEYSDRVKVCILHAFLVYEAFDRVQAVKDKMRIDLCFQSGQFKLPELIFLDQTVI